ncbi:MAG: DUF4331 family protein [Acetobacteraceae bacterium]|nr:DUF4331 family protein [Acetobacteraceae bacterium]
MSHHYSGPRFGFPNGDARLDLTDLYAFPKPGDEGKSVLIMNVHPSFSFDPPGPTTSIPFAPDAIYEFRIDTNGDNVADLAYQVVFSPFTSGGQTATLRLITGPQATAAEGGGELLIEGAAVSLDPKATVTEGGGHRFFVGWRSDPFFFDPVGALNGLRFGKDFFTDKDVCSIVLEVPNSVLGLGQVGLWARTMTSMNGRWVQADRGARPAQSIFLTGEAREAYLAAEPADDATFIATFAHSLEHAGGYAPGDAQRIAGTLLPDILPFDHTQAASYPSNGRTLTDDVLDLFLAILTNGKVTTDGLGPHDDLIVDFPYLGPPHRCGASGPRGIA